MGRIILGTIGIALSFLLIKYRESVGDSIGDPEWASKVGGIYNVIVLCGIFGFFWSVSYMTNTLDILFAPILWLLPNNNAGNGGVPLGEF
jgi:hypothetical protein